MLQIGCMKLSDVTLLEMPSGAAVRSVGGIGVCGELVARHALAWNLGPFLVLLPRCHEGHSYHVITHMKVTGPRDGGLSL